MKSLIIVESPAKARTIQRFVDKSFTVKATMGHVRDLPKSKLGVDIENNFQPEYVKIKGKQKVVNELKKEAQACENVYLASDPDREGEAIAWHLAELIGTGNTHRIELHEITKKAVLSALEHPEPINMNMVNAQQARRVLDRLVGYKLSPLLWKKVTRGLSAGRVQSVAVRIICEREREILAFKPEEYWKLTSVLEKKDKSAQVKSLLIEYNGEKIKPGKGEEMDVILSRLEGGAWKVVNVGRKEQQRKPPPPFITSTLQQEASRRLYFRVSRTMQIAQQLYEGVDIGSEGTVGLITYMRTDSTRVSQAAKAEAQEFVRREFGPEAATEGPFVKKRPNVQDAHEAIRPTSVFRTPDSVKSYLSLEQFRLYKLIWSRFVAGYMQPIVMDIVTADIDCNDYRFRATGSTVKFPGFTVLYGDVKNGNNKDNNKDSNKDEEEKNTMLPPLEAGEPLDLLELIPEQLFTQPPPRYNEASLIKILEEKGIGRPSTYAPIVSTIQKREYVELKEKRFYPTKLGFIVTEILEKHFPNIVDVEFTAQMEGLLDGVEEGKTEWTGIIGDFYFPFEKELIRAENEVVRVEMEPEVSEKVCPNCGRNLVVRKSRFGKFLGCPGFPDCKFTMPLLEEIGLPCPNEGCSGTVVVKNSRRGKFYGCSRYPECDFVSWYRPTDKRCEKCSSIMVLKFTRDGKAYMTCSNRNCPDPPPPKGEKAAAKKTKSKAPAKKPKKTIAGKKKTAVKKTGTKKAAKKTKPAEETEG